MTITFSIDQLTAVAQQIIDQNPHKVILFNGEMGVGKTTLIKQLCKTLGVNDATSSPTFSLVNEYQTTTNHIVYHFDFYRLKAETEALDYGLEEYFYSGNLCLCEWPSMVPNLWPYQYLMLNLNILDDGSRVVNINKNS